jgi:hypothetical protein
MMLKVVFALSVSLRNDHESDSTLLTSSEYYTQHDDTQHKGLIRDT